MSSRGSSPDRGDKDAVLALVELTAWSLRTPNSRHFARRVYGQHIDLTADLLAQAAPDTARTTLDTVARLINMTLDGIYLQVASPGR